MNKYKLLHKDNELWNVTVEADHYYVDENKVITFYINSKPVGTWMSHGFARIFKDDFAEKNDLE